MTVLLTVSAVFAFLLSLHFNAFTVRAQTWPASSILFSDSYLSASAPVLTVSSDNSTLYMAFEGTNNGIYIASTTNVMDWPLDPTPISGQSSNSGSSPALIGFKGKMVLAYRSSGSTQILTGVSTDGVTWNSISFLPNTFAAARGPRFTIANGILYLYYQGADNSIYFATSSDGSTWGDPTVIPSQTTSEAPALIEFKSKLVLAFRSAGSNQILTGVSTDGQTFASINYLPSFYQSLNGLVLATYGDNLYLLYQDPSGAMYYSISSDGVSWPNTVTRVLPNDATSLAPALQEFKGQLVLTFRSSGSNNLLIAYTSS